MVQAKNHTMKLIFFEIVTGFQNRGRDMCFEHKFLIFQRIL